MLRPGLAAGHPATVEAGIEILEEGGTAADAAVAASLASCVAETVMTGLLGGGDAPACRARRLPRDARTGDDDERGRGDLLARRRAPGPRLDSPPAGSRGRARDRRRGGRRQRLPRLARNRAARADGGARRSR